jgi:hypothetical protein
VHQVRRVWQVRNLWRLRLFDAALMKVLKEQCATCIFRPGNLMHLQKGRVKEMVAQCKAQDTHIPCHEHMEYVHEWADEDADADYETTPDSPVCRGFYNRYPGVGQMIRIFERLGRLEEVDG